MVYCFAHDHCGTIKLIISIRNLKAGNNLLWLHDHLNYCSIVLCDSFDHLFDRVFDLFEQNGIRQPITNMEAKLAKSIKSLVIQQCLQARQCNRIAVENGLISGHSQILLMSADIVWGFAAAGELREMTVT
jgi:hypothetical protein